MRLKYVLEKNPENLSERSAVGKSIAGKKKEDSIITRKSIVCARKVLQNIMESGTNFTRKNILGRSTGDAVCGRMIIRGIGVPGTAMSLDMHLGLISAMGLATRKQLRKT